MPRPRGQPLVVEGPNDHHSVLHLLRRENVLPADADEISSPISFVQAGNKKKLLGDLPTRWKEAGTTAIGYVLDADHDSGDPPGLQPTWNAVQYRLNPLGVIVPSQAPADGFIGRVGEDGPQIGVWIMPNNQQNGAVEEFLLGMLDPAMPLLSFARSCTEAARVQHGAQFTESDQAKAELSSWLAWQEEPAQRYGEAMQAGKFGKSTPASIAFVNWVRQLYGL